MTNVVIQTLQVDLDNIDEVTFLGEKFEEIGMKGLDIREGELDEHVAFQPWCFNAEPIINVKARGHRATDIILTSSYELRLIGHDTYLAHCQDIEAPDTLILTSSMADIPFKSSLHTNVFHITEVAAWTTSRPC